MKLQKEKVIMNNNKTTILFQCPEDLKKEASKALAASGISVSEFLRTCLQHFCEKNAASSIQSKVKEVADSAIKELI
jgi:hypothetical protein